MKNLTSARYFSFSAALIVLIPLLTVAPAQSVMPRRTETETTGIPLGDRKLSLFGNNDLPLIVELQEPSVAVALVAEEAAAKGAPGISYQSARPIGLGTTRAFSHRQRIQAEQSAFVRRLNLLGGAEVTGSTDTVLNAVFVRMPQDRREELERLPGVKKVYSSRVYRLALDYAAGVQNAQGAWTKAGGSAGAGAGVRIGIIDTGVDINNPMVQDDSLTPPTGFPKGDTAYTNKKVIVARNYVTTANGYYQQTVQSPMDEVGHGTFVSGCAAGHQTAAPSGTIAGMAQGAFLGEYKVFGTPGTNDGATSLGIIAAVNDAVNDGMNVLNLSLGALGYTPAAEDAESIALANAISYGVVVALAAGNDGPDNFTISNPGSMPEAITVGAVSNSRVFTYHLHATAPAPVPSNLLNVSYVPGSGLSLSSNINAPVVDIATLDPAGTACSTSALASGSLTGKIALISRGTCTFLEKAQNAANAGAVAVIVYQNTSGGSASIMAGTEASPIPAVMISNANGMALKDLIAANPAQAAVEIDVAAPSDVTPRVLSDFSSRGPSPDFNLKPDLVAVGEHVYSATQKNDTNGVMYDSSRFFYGNGTSFSTPMVAGAAAVLKQLYPNFTPQDIKSALTTTSSRNISLAGGGGTPDLIRAGAGLLDMTSAANVGATFSPSSLSFGARAYSSGMSLTKTIVLKNVSSASDSFNIIVEPLVSGPGIVLSKTATGSISSGGTSSVDVTIQPTGPMTGAFQGFITVQSANTSAVYRIPYWSGIYVPENSRVLSVSSSGTGGSGVYRTLNDAIGNARPGNVIEIADSATYQVAATLAVNNDGLPLHGLTIRAAPGATPTLTGTGTGASYDLQIIGLSKVLLQGLNISGGYIGVYVLQPSSTLPTSVAIDHCTITNMQDYGDGAGVYSWGAAVTITQSTISYGGSYGVYAGTGSRLTLSRSTVSSNQYFSGIEGYRANVQILNSTLQANNGPGARLTYCSGTIEGNTISGSVDGYYYGDGLSIRDGRFTISGNIVEGNSGRGIFLYTPVSGGAGPAVLISGNTTRANQGYGILANPSKDCRLEGNLITSNGVGVLVMGGSSVLAVNNIITKSLGSLTGSVPGYGVWVTDSSSVRLVNNTIHGNQTGISLESGSTCPVWNTIFSGNTRDADVPVGTIQYSLVTDSAYAKDTNITGDPKFTDANNDDFSLGSGSPAIDAGSNTAADLPFLDYNRKLRVMSTSSRPGEGKVDMGAIEYGSAYPLVFPLLANGQQTSLGDNLITGFAVLNGGAASAKTIFTAYDQSGGLLGGATNPSQQTISSGTQVPILGPELFFGKDFGISAIGSVLASSDSKLTGFFLLFDKNFSRFADGVDVSDGAATNLTFPRNLNDSGGDTHYVVSNPGVNTANVVAKLYDTSGISSGIPKTSAIPAKGQYIFSLSDVPQPSGYVRVSSDQPVAGLEIFGGTPDMSAIRASAVGSEGVLYFPHFAVNSGFSTVIGVTNTAGDPSNLVITAYNSDGSRIGMPVTRSLAANGQLFESVAGMFSLGSGSLFTGYLTISSDKGGIAGYTGFKYDGGSVQSSAAVPAISVPRPKLIFSHIANDAAAGNGTYFTGIALLNPYGVPVQYTMKVFDNTGAVKATLTDTIGAGQKISKYLSHPSAGAGYFTQALALSSGHIEVTSDVGLIGFELFYTPDVSQLSSVPAQ